MALIAAIAALGLLALGSASAPASTTLRTDPGGGLLSGSTTVTSTSNEPVVMPLNLGTVTCNSLKFDADVTSNSSATSIAGTLTGLTLTSCTDTIPVISVGSCHASTTPAVSITANDTGGHMNLTDVLVRCPVAGGPNACYFTAATATGVELNATSSLAYTNVATVYPASNPADGLGGNICGATGTFSATLTHLVQGGTNATLTITTGSPPPPVTTALRTDPGGGRLSGSTTLTNTASEPSVLQTNLGTVTCSSTKFDANMTSNSATSIAGTLASLTFTTCTDTIPVISVSSCHASTTPAVSITANATGGHMTVTDVLARCGIAGSASACYFTAATATGAFVNSTSSLAYNNVSVVYPASNPADGLGSGICGSAATFSTTLTHIVQGGTNATITVTTA
jgi:hypothetical protein